METLRVLVAVDASPASDRAVEYTGRVLGTLEGVQLYLVHVVGPLPDGVRAAPGETLTNTRRDEQAAWMATAREDARGVLERAAQRLRSAGIDERAISLRTAELANGTVATCVLEAARDLDCDTIVVGREAITWVPNLLHPHIGERVVREATHAAVWIVA